MAETFHPAKHRTWIIRIAQWGNALDLFLHNRLPLSPRDIATLTAIPLEAGLILALNHADEMDIRVCMEVARAPHSPPTGKTPREPAIESPRPSATRSKPSSSRRSAK